MTIGVIVQVRLDSERLSGKVLKDLAGKPMLQYVLESLSKVRTVDRLLVATSDRRSDDPIADFCAGQQWETFRGEAHDVAGRLLAAAEHYKLDMIVRICGDSPLLDWRLIDRAAVLAAERNMDLVTNVFPRSFPKGQSVEVISAEALRRAHSVMAKPDDQEHVTRYFYDHPADFRILNFDSGHKWDDLNLSVDTPDDFKRVEFMIKHMDGPPWQYSVEELVALAEQEAMIAA